jgi:hypothetical protein
MPELAATRMYREKVASRFPAELRRSATEDDLAKVRDLLKAAGGDIDTLASWAGAVLDTDDDAAALVALDAREEWARLIRRATAAGAEAKADAASFRAAVSKLIAEQAGQPGRPRASSYAAIDDEMLAEANRRFCVTRRPPMEIVREVVCEFAAEGRAIGQSESAAVQRLFSLIRPRTVSGGHWRWTAPPARWDLEIAYGVSRRKRGVRKMGRPARL